MTPQNDIYINNNPEINILVPGRHHLTTSYWEQYIKKLVKKDLCESLSVTGEKLNFAPGIKAKNVIFPVTSANHSGTRRNPLTYTQRAILLDRFGQSLKSSSKVNSFPYPIDDIPPSEHFADYILKKVEIENKGRLTLTPENTVVLSSTPDIIRQFQALGYQILPAELKP
jgi:hypothetical protein